MRVAIVGGGPAGLFFARLMKRRAPHYSIEIIEQNPADATYGFGVTLAGAARDRLLNADRRLHDALAANMIFNDEQAIVLNDNNVLLKYAAKGGAIARLRLLELMEELCAECGLTVEHNRRIETADDLSGYDLVVGADGANSAIRNRSPEAFGVHTRELDNRFAWYGVGKALKPNALVFRETRYGRLIAHYYSYTDRMSTFVAECDGEAWNEKGFAALTDAERKAVFEESFSQELGGASLIENKSIWRRFNATTCARWYVGNTVLIGDALRVAHPSIGSGTRLAMDDAAALNDALRDSADDVPAGLRRYVETRKPTRDLFTDATVKSFEWYENVARPMKLDVVAFARDFLMRTGRVDEQRLRSYVPDFYRTYLTAQV